MRQLLAIAFCALVSASAFCGTYGGWQLTYNGTVQLTIPTESGNGTVTNGQIVSVHESGPTSGYYYFIVQGNNGTTWYRRVKSLYADASFPVHVSWICPVSGSTFAHPPYVLTVINGTGSGSYSANTSVTVSASLSGNQTFLGWNATGMSAPGSANATFSMPSNDVTLTASIGADPALDPVAYKVKMHCSEPIPSGGKLVYTLQFKDGMKEKLSMPADSSGSAEFILGGLDKNRPYSVTYGVYDEASGALVWSVSDTNSFTATLPAYDGETTTPQTTNGTSSLPSISSTVAGSVVSSNGSAQPITQYSVNDTANNSKSTTTVAGDSVTTYKGNAIVGGGEGGSFVSSSASADSPDLTDIKNLIRSGNLNADASAAENNKLLADIAESARKVAANTSPTPTPTPGSTGFYPFSLTADSLWNWIASKIPAPDTTLPESTPSSVPRGSGSSGFWHLTFLGYTLNFDPASDPNVGIIANWVFTFLTWYASILLFLKCQDLMWQTVTEMIKAPQTDPPDVNVEIATFGGNLGFVSYPLVVIFIVTTFATFYTALSTGMNTRLPISYANIVTSGDSLFSSGGGSFGAAMALLMWFVPVGHILTCLGVYAWFLFGRIPIYLSWRLVKAWIPA